MKSDLCGDNGAAIAGAAGAAGVTGAADVVGVADVDVAGGGGGGAVLGSAEGVAYFLFRVSTMAASYKEEKYRKEA